MSSYRADIFNEDGRKAGSQHLNVRASGDRLRDMDTASGIASHLLHAGQYADLYEDDGTGRAIYVDTVHAQEVPR